MHTRCTLQLAILLTLSFVTLAWAQSWAPTDNPLMTPFAADVGPDNAWPEHPRPQMVRDRWLNLNGLWDYALEPVDFKPVQGLIKRKTMTRGQAPKRWKGKILVPFAIDSALSGVKHILRPTERLWYRRTFKIPEIWTGRVLLHFQASDWETGVYVNGKRLGQHRGGYDPFTFDITDAITGTDNELTVCVWDGTEQQCQAIGKQIMPENRKGFRYQPTGGIWRTVWLENVPETYIERLRLTPLIDEGKLAVAVKARKVRPADGYRIIILAEGKELMQYSFQVARIERTSNTTTVSVEFDIQPGQQGVDALSVMPSDVQFMPPVRAANIGSWFKVAVPKPILWSPERPHLYDLKVQIVRKDKVIDEVKSYFGMRKIEIKEADDGFVRIHLNNKPIFQYGPLDQGYWPDGILTPPSDAAAKFDLQYLKDIGCNMVRVHIKTHPDRWYYWADRLGLLVWQDMICMPKYGQTVDAAAAAQWQKEFEGMIDSLGNHPSIVQWVVFNEGWSQHDTRRYTEWVKDNDPSRLVIDASGWTHEFVGDIWDIHDYSFYPGVVEKADARNRAILLGEAGGHNLAILDHTWYDRESSRNINYVNELGRMTFSTPEEMLDGYGFWLEGLRALNAGAGCNAVVYTQITDVEHELNGFLTYDRKVSKVDKATLRKMHGRLYAVAKLTPVDGHLAWRYTEKPLVKAKRSKPTAPADYTGAWTKPGFDDSSWKTLANFTIGHEDRVGDNMTTSAKAGVVYMRAGFDLKKVPSRPMLKVTGRGACDVYLNGALLRRVQMRARVGEESKVSFIPLRDDELRLLQKGPNTLAVVVKQVQNESRFGLTIVKVDG